MQNELIKLSDITLYHSSNIPYSKGGIIIPGNWGRGVLNLGTTYKFWFREVTLEAIRLNFFNFKPSRHSNRFRKFDFNLTKWLSLFIKQPIVQGQILKF